MVLILQKRKSRSGSPRAHQGHTASAGKAGREGTWAWLQSPGTFCSITVPRQTSLGSSGSQTGELSWRSCSSTGCWPLPPQFLIQLVRVGPWNLRF